MLVVTRALGLTLGTALVIHPVLGTAVRANSGPTPSDFLTAMYVGGKREDAAELIARLGPRGQFQGGYSTVSLDAVSLILSALDEREYSWLQESGAVAELWAASRLAITSLAATFLSRGVAPPGPPSAEAKERWQAGERLGKEFRNKVRPGIPARCVRRRRA